MELTDFFAHLAGSETSRELADALAGALELRQRREIREGLAQAS